MSKGNGSNNSLCFHPCKAGVGLAASGVTALSPTSTRFAHFSRRHGVKGHYCLLCFLPLHPDFLSYPSSIGYMYKSTDTWGERESIARAHTHTQVVGLTRSRVSKSNLVYLQYKFSKSESIICFIDERRTNDDDSFHS